MERIHSDNGSNFVGTAKELRMMIKSWRENKEEKSKLRTVVEDNIIDWTLKVQEKKSKIFSPGLQTTHVR